MSTTPGTAPGDAPAAPQTWQDVPPGVRIQLEHCQALFWKFTLKPMPLRIQVLLAQGALKGIK